MNNACRILLAALFLAASGAFAGETQPPQDAASQAAQPQQIVVTPDQAFAVMVVEAEKGNPRAMLTLGTLYEQGVGAPRNFVKALEWYERAAAAGSAEASYRVGVAYEIGLGNTGDIAKAFASFERSAELNLPDGFYKLASMYIGGTGTEKNESWGVALLNRAVGLGHAAAANDLGVIYFEGMYGQGKDTQKAYDMFMQAAEGGNAEAMKNIGVFYRDGIDRPADPAQELKWYLLALTAGYRVEAVAAAANQLREHIGPDAAAQVEQDVKAWIEDFQAKAAARNAAQAAG